MDICFQTLETISLTDKLSNSFACQICEDGRISLMTDDNIFVYTLLNYMDNEFGDMAFRKIVIQLPKSSLKEQFDNELIEQFDNIVDDFSETMAKLDINNCLEYSTGDIKPLSLKWSPKGLYGSSYSVLAILNNLYGLSIMVEYRDITECLDYRCVSNVTKHIYDQASKDWAEISSVIGELTIEEWKQRGISIRPIIFEWSHLIQDTSETYAILFVAHPSGAITFWKFARIDVNDLESEPLQFVGMLISSLKNATSMHWKRLGRKVGTLCLGNDEGNLSVIRISNMNTENFHYEEEQILVANENKMEVIHITSFDYSEYYFIITVFEAFLNIIAVLGDGSVLDEVWFNTGNTMNTGLCHFKDNILLLLTGEKLRRLTLNVVDNKVEIKDECVSVDFDGSRYRSNGIVLSKNRIFLGILAYPLRLKDVTKHPTPSKFFIYHNTTVSPLDMILSNTDEGLADYWDYFEVLRLLSVREKNFPWQGIPNLDYDKLTLTQLKSLRWISKLSEKLYNIVPKINGYHIKPYILLHYLVTIQLVVQRMRKLLNALCRGEQLSVFQMRSLDISNMFLKEMVMMKILEKCKIGENFLDDITGVMEIANELEYPDMPSCFWCREKIVGPSCIPPHADSRCSISMMQIYLTPGFKCPFCNCVAHIEIAEEYDIVTCPYCDIPMYKRYPQKYIHNVIEGADEEIKHKMELSMLKDTPQDFEDGTRESDLIEDFENEIEYIALSESEEEDNLIEKMQTLYNEFFDLNRSGIETKDIEGVEGYSDDRTEENTFLEEEELEESSSDEQRKENQCSDQQLKEKYWINDHVMEKNDSDDQDDLH